MPLAQFESRIRGKVDVSLFERAWRRGQQLRTKLEELQGGFFIELVNRGIDVEDAPNLGDFTPHWEPLSDSWVERKGGDENFYFDTGELEADLLRKNPRTLFGRPQVFIEYDDVRVKIHAGEPAKKHQQGMITRKYRLAYTIFPRMAELTAVEQVFEDTAEIDKIYYKLRNPKGLEFRPLLTPFAQWYMHVFVRRNIR